MPDPLPTAALERLQTAEERGLRLAIACRTLVIGLALAWYTGATVLFSDFEPRFLAVLALLAFVAIGVAHLRVIGTDYDRWWIKYAVYAVDILAVCAMFAVIPIGRDSDIPQIIAFRAYGIYYLFPLVVMASLSLSWRLVLWAGAMAVVGWWASFTYVASLVSAPLSWADIPPDATRLDYEMVFLSIDFIGRGNRIEETGMLFFGAAILAVAVYRARQVFFAQVTAEIERGKERAARERITDLLGRYVPEAVAQRLIDDPASLAPRVTYGSVLVLDIADFTSYASGRDPRAVIAALDGFLARCSEAIGARDGVVITYTGDGLLATFNAPLPVAAPETHAAAAGLALLEIAAATEFKVRVGIASGDIVAGNIGSSRRQSFTVYGETVNLASRLEGAAKQLGRPLLMDATTFDKLADPLPFAFHATERVRGLTEPVVVHGL